MENCAWAAHTYQSVFLEDLSNEVKLGLSCWTVMWLQLPPACARCGRNPGCCLLLWAGCELSPLAPGVPHSSDLTGIQYLCAGRSGPWYLFRCLRNQFLCFDARRGVVRGTGRCRHSWKWPVHVEDGKGHLRVLRSFLPLSVTPRSQHGQGGSTELLSSALLYAVVQRKLKQTSGVQVSYY